LIGNKMVSKLGLMDQEIRGGGGVPAPKEYVAETKEGKGAEDGNPTLWSIRDVEKLDTNKNALSNLSAQGARKRAMLLELVLKL
jgi:hypothetical protein